MKDTEKIELTKLEKIILDKIRSVGPNGMPGYYVDAIMPEITKKIEQAFEAGYKRAWVEGQIEIPELEKVDEKVFPNKDQWLKDNL